MHKTYIIFAFSLVEVRAARLAAKSIKASNTDSGVILVTPTKFEEIDYYVFDKVTMPPYGYFPSKSTEEHWWQAPSVVKQPRAMLISPYTIINEPQDDLWEYLDLNYDVCVPSKYVDFRDQNTVKSEDYISKTDLPGVVSDAIFFKTESDKCHDFFQLFELMSDSYAQLIEALLEPKYVPDNFDTRAIIPCLCSIIGEDTIDHDTWKYIFLQNWRTLNIYVTSNNTIRFNNYTITGNISYGYPSTIETVIHQLEDNYAY